MKRKYKYIICALSSYKLDDNFIKQLQSQLYLDEEIKKIDVVYKDNLQDLVATLKNKEADFLVLPSRLTYTNDVSPICMDLIQRSFGDKINEIFSAIDRTASFELDDINSQTPYYFGGKKYVKSSPKENAEDNNFLEYKVFKNNTYRTNIFMKGFLWLFTRKLSNLLIKLTNVVSMAIIVVYFILLLVNRNTNLKLWGELIPLVTIFLQILIEFCDFEKTAEQSLITGYWIYYSFEDTYELGNYVPKGFTTRLLEVNQKFGELSMSCSFSGNDTLFWSCDDLSYDYNPASLLCRGSYSYNSNIINAKGKRPEGSCMFKGRSENLSKISYMDGWFSGRGTMINGRVKYIRISKEDFEMLKRAFPDRSTTFEHSTVVVGIFGDPGSNTDFAFESQFRKEKLFQDNRVIKKYYSSFSEIFYDLESKKINLTVLPISNKNEPIKANFEGKDKELEDLFNIFNYDKSEDKDVEISYVFCSNDKDSTINDNTRFLSNKEALEQCGFDINKDRVLLYSSTSEAARSAYIGETSKNDIIICNRMAAKIYNLFTLKRNGKEINPYKNKEINITKFRIYKQ